MWDATGSRPSHSSVVRAEEYRRRQPSELARRLLGDADALLMHLRYAFPIALAFGRTVHAAQGGTIRAPCRVDLRGVPPRRHGLVYVCLSRFVRPEAIRFECERRSNGVLKLPFSADRCWADPRVCDFYKRLLCAPRPVWVRW